MCARRLAETWSVWGAERRGRKKERAPTHRSIVLVKLVEEGAHPVVVELEHPRVERRNHPWPLRVKRDPCAPA